jgi:hypothetical protein
MVKIFEREYAQKGGALKEYFYGFGIRKRVAEEIERRIAIVKETNPRFKSQKAISPSLDECVSQVKRLVLQLPELHFSYTSKELKGTKKGAEVCIEIADPSIISYLDYYDGKKIMEFKTGARDLAHEDQVKFYAAVVFQKYGVIAQRMQILYASDGSVVEVEKLDAEQCLRLLDQFREEIVLNESFIRTGDFQKNVGERCVYCHVRHMCDKYWELKHINFLQELNVIDDIELKIIEPLRKTNNAVMYKVVLGEHYNAILQCNLSETIPRDICVRILKAKVSRRRGVLMISMRDDSELFMLDEIQS